MVRSAHTGGAHDPTSDGPPTAEVETSIAPLADSIARRADILPPAFVCSRTNGGLEAAWVHVAGDLDIATAPQLERTLRDSSSQARLVVHDLREHRVHGLLRRARHRQRQHQRSAARPSANSPSRPPNVDRVFTLTGSTGAVEIADLDLDPAALPVQALQRLTAADRAP